MLDVRLPWLSPWQHLKLVVTLARGSLVGVAVIIAVAVRIVAAVLGLGSMSSDQSYGLILLCLVAFLFTVVTGLSYHPLSAEQRARVATSTLHHFTRADPALLVDPSGQLHLSKRFCRLRSLAFRRDRPWYMPRKAVFFFVGGPTEAGMRTNLRSPEQITALVTISGADVLNRLLIRRDGCLALRGDYTGPGQVTAARVIRTPWRDRSTPGALLSQP